MPLPLHNPPGFSNDLTEENRIKWSAQISEFMLTDNVSPILTPQFYDAVKVQEVSTPDTAKITWIGFPKVVKLKNPNDRKRWEIADGTRDVQDEYLEWSIKRNADGKITRIVFCNEGPEYYEFLGIHQPDTLLKLYQDLNPGYDIKITDIAKELPDGTWQYIPLNKWNNSTTTGTIMHLIQVNNTLGAEVDLGARATIIRKRADGTIITDPQELIKCSKYGNANRNSDPTIGAGINSLARQGMQLTINDPVGLYIDSVDWNQVSPPLGHEDDDPSTFWKWTRGAPGTYMRGEFEVPADKDYVLGDLLVNGNPLEFGGQIADLISVSITGRGFYYPDHKPADPKPCPGQLPTAVPDSRKGKWGCTRH